MRYSGLKSRKFRYGSVAVAMTALVVAVVIMINAGISALAQKFGWYTDMTKKNIYSLTGAAKETIGENIDKTIKERKKRNADMPQTNFDAAEENVDRMKENIKIAETNIEEAEVNIAIAELNRRDLAKNGALADANVLIAKDNLDMAEDMFEYIKAREEDVEANEKSTEDDKKQAKENTESAKKTLADAEKNLETAKKNVEKVEANKGKTDEYEPLGEYIKLEVVPGYKYFGEFEKQICDEDTGTAGENRAIAESNRATAEANLRTAEKNVGIARKNLDAGLTPGEPGYVEAEAFAEYAKFGEFSTYAKLGKSGTFRKYEAFCEPLEASGLFGELKVNIIFCDERDKIREKSLTRYVLETAEDIQREFPDIVSVHYEDIWTNPGAVQRFKTSALTNIYSTNVIIESGTEFRIYSLNSFFVFNDNNSTEPWSYNGEKKFASAILSVIKAESPVACVTINHGEMFKDPELLGLLSDSGYIVKTLDLAAEEIPEDCRLMVVCNPKSDFLVKDAVSDISEIAKLSKWLDKFNSLMVFMSPDTPVLPNFEEYLEEWGIKYERLKTEDGAVYPYMVKDPTQSLTADGMTVVGEYATKGLGSSVHKEMRSVPVPAKVIFKNAMPISYAENYEVVNYENEEDKTDTYRYGNYFSNGVSRSIYDIFTSSPNAVALANGEQVASATTLEPFKLMTITREQQRASDNNDFDSSYVIACSSTEFVCRDMLQSIVYGNSAVLTSALRTVGRDVVFVDLAHKPFDKPKIESLTTAAANRDTALLTVIPALIVTVIGIYVVVRRKYS